jgi:glutamine amidotransferase
MCRLFAVRAERLVRAEPALVSAPHALVRQSCCDLRGECHPSGWGIGYYANGEPVRVRSVRPAAEDPLYREAARAAVGTTIVGHVRQASVGGVSEANTHPFAHGRWLFAHNGTVQGFAADPGPLRRLIPAHLREQIKGETDSEHLFYALLGELARRGVAGGDAVAAVVGDTLREVARLYPGTPEEPTRLNVVLADGDVLVASRWGHTLHLTELSTPGVVEAADGAGVALRGLAVASEPVTPAGWVEVPDRAVVLIRAGRPALVNRLEPDPGPADRPTT